MEGEQLAAVVRVALALDGLGVAYVVGGSLASSLHGVPRSTRDADLMALLGPEHVTGLTVALRPHFYMDERAVRAAIEAHGSVNAIHLVTMFKIDLFVPAPHPWVDEELRRALTETVRGPAGPYALRFSSAEDTVLQKLRWFRLGREVSERQWRDVLDVLRIQAGRLDEAYLTRWAAQLGLDGLLERARREAAVPGGSTP